MKKQVFFYALLLMTLLQACTSAQAVKVARSEPWTAPLRLLGF